MNWIELGGSRPMPNTPEAGGEPEHLQDQIVRLREQVEALLKEKVTPAVSAFAGRAEDAIHGATQTARNQADAIAGHVRERPLVSLLIAAAVGWLIGRAMR
jgi:ElaB/YqjD/DUF883 family membrane-anchored ribosome-binding protein